jgi:hypothetical protein
MERDDRFGSRAVGNRCAHQCACALAGGERHLSVLPTNRCHLSKSIVFFFLFHFTATGFAK